MPCDACAANDDVMQTPRVLTLATRHWEYVESVLNTHSIPTTDIEKAGNHYIAAFVHGYKHGVEEADLHRVPKRFRGWIVAENDDGQIAIAKIVQGRWVVFSVGNQWDEAKAKKMISTIDPENSYECAAA